MGQPGSESPVLNEISKSSRKSLHIGATVRASIMLALNLSRGHRYHYTSASSRLVMVGQPSLEMHSVAKNIGHYQAFVTTQLGFLRAIRYFKFSQGVVPYSMLK